MKAQLFNQYSQKMSVMFGHFIEIFFKALLKQNFGGKPGTVKTVSRVVSIGIEKFMVGKFIVVSSGRVKISLKRKRKEN